MWKFLRLVPHTLSDADFARGPKHSRDTAWNREYAIRMQNMMKAPFQGKLNFDFFFSLACYVSLFVCLFSTGYLVRAEYRKRFPANPPHVAPIKHGNVPRTFPTPVPSVYQEVSDNVG